MLDKMLEQMQEKRPLTHCITNYVTVNDVANMLLACGASPVMADEADEVEEISTISSGLFINIGTLNHRTIKSMFLAGKKANSLHHAVLLDPVGVGASNIRTQTALDLMKEIKFCAIRGNISEIKTLLIGSGQTRGVDANPNDETDLDANIRIDEKLAERYNTIVVASGATDIVTDGHKTYLVKNGTPEMSKITGTGDQLSALMTAFLAANPEEHLTAALAATCMMGLCGEIGLSHLTDYQSYSALRSNILDAVGKMTPADLEGGSKYEETRHS